MSQHNNLEKLIYGLAFAQIVSDMGDRESWYSAYQYLCESVDKNEEPALTAWEPFEKWTWEDLLNQVETEAQSTMIIVQRILDLAKTGIIESAINDELDTDMNALDLKYMIELGAEHEKSA